MTIITDEKVSFARARFIGRIRLVFIN